MSRSYYLSGVEFYLPDTPCALAKDRERERSDNREEMLLTTLSSRAREPQKSCDLIAFINCYLPLGEAGVAIPLCYNSGCSLKIH